MRRKKPPPLVIPHSNFGDASKEIIDSPSKTRKTSVSQSRPGLRKRRKSEVRNRKKSTKDIKFHTDSKIRRKSRSKSLRDQENDAKKRGLENKLQAKPETVDNRQKGMAGATSPLANGSCIKNALKQTAKKGVHFSSAARQEEGHIDVVGEKEEGGLRSDVVGSTKENRRVSETKKSVGALKLPLCDSGRKGHEEGLGLLPSVDAAEVNGQRQRDRITEKNKLASNPTRDSIREPRTDKKQGLLEDVATKDVNEKGVVLTSKKASIIVGKRRGFERVATKDLPSKVHPSKLHEEEGSSKIGEAGTKEGLTREMKTGTLQDDKGVNGKKKDRRKTLEKLEEELNSEICDDTREIRDRKGKATNGKAKLLKDKGLASEQNKESVNKTMNANSPMLSPIVKGEDNCHGKEIVPKVPQSDLSLTNAEAAIGINNIQRDKVRAPGTSEEANIENKGDTNKGILKRKRGSVPKVSELADLRANLGVINDKVKKAEGNNKEIVIHKKVRDEDLGAYLNGKKCFSKEKEKSNNNENIAAGKIATDSSGNVKSDLPLMQNGEKCDLHGLKGKQKIKKEVASEKDRGKLASSFDFVDGKAPISEANSTDKPHAEEKENLTKEQARKILGKKELHGSFKKEAMKTTWKSIREEESPNKIDATKGREDRKTEGSIEQTNVITEGNAEGAKDTGKNKLVKLKSKSSSIDSQKRTKQSFSQSTEEPSPGVREVMTEDVFQELNQRRASVVEIDAQRRFRKLSSILQTPLLSPKNKSIFDFSADAKKANRTRRQSIVSIITDQKSMSPRSKKIFNFNQDNTIAFKYSEMPFYCVVDSKCCYRSKTKQEQVKHHMTRHSSQTPFFCITCLKFGSKVAFGTRLGLVSHEKELKHDLLPTVSSALIR